MIKTIALAVSTVVMTTGAAQGCDDSGSKSKTPLVVVVGDGDYKTKNIHASVIKADAPGKTCEWWLFYDIPNRPNKVLILAHGFAGAQVNVKKKYGIKNTITHRVQTFKATSFRTDDCGRWIKVR